ncbi:MAG TPA: hypothetical protein VGC87_19510 [Pyrinomonadaceae bacterium]|jgi:hypothetical protein
MSAAAASEEGPAALRWGGLPERTRAALDRRLVGLYGGERDAEVFDSLPLDKQQALLILARRLTELKLWDAVRRVENLYAEGGVGMHFVAWPILKSALRGRRNFSTWFATHKNTTLGFIERGKRLGSLHILYSEGSAGVRWEAHFDLYNPWASPVNAWLHLLHEKMRREVPDWRIIGAALGYNDE